MTLRGVSEESEATREAESTWHSRLLSRNRLVAAAVGAGASQRQVANAAGISRSLVRAIVAAALLADALIEHLRTRRPPPD